MHWVHVVPHCRRGQLRGLHLRRGQGEAKLSRHPFRTIFDVILDLRPNSLTFRNWQSLELRDDQQLSLFVPASCAHGFQALTQQTDVSYRIDRVHDPAQDAPIAHDDPQLGITWPSPVTAISPRAGNARH